MSEDTLTKQLHNFEVSRPNEISFCAYVVLMFINPANIKSVYKEIS